MTLVEISNLNYVIGKLEGIASGVEQANVQNALLDVAELLSEMLTEKEVTE